MKAMVVTNPLVEATLAGALDEMGLDSVQGAFACAGGDDLHKPGLGTRRRTRLTISEGPADGTQLYLKRYGPPGARDRLRYLWTHGRGRAAGWVEYDNVLAAQAAGVTAMEAIRFGQDAGGRSFVILSAVAGDALERCGQHLLSRGEQAARQLTASLADLVRRLHGSGMVHRDLYASHVFAWEEGDTFALGLIDLARAFRPRWRHGRWRVKDLAQLRYSMPPEWVSCWWDSFLSEYGRGLWDVSLAGLARAVAAKEETIRRRAARRKS